MIHIPNSIFSVPQCYKLQLQLQNTLKKYQFQVFVIFSWGGHEISKWVKNQIRHFLWDWGGDIDLFKIQIFFVWNAFLSWLQGCQMRGGGQGHRSNHRHCLRRREKLVEGGGGEEEGWTRLISIVSKPIKIMVVVVVFVVFFVQTH